MRMVEKTNTDFSFFSLLIFFNIFILDSFKNVLGGKCEDDSKDKHGCPGYHHQQWHRHQGIHPLKGLFYRLSTSLT